MFQDFFEGYTFYLPEKRWQSLLLFIILLLQYIAEHILPAERKNNQPKNEGKNMLIGMGNMLLLFIPAALLVELLWWLKANEIGLFNSIHFSPWLNVILTILLMDGIMYWWHRFNHRWALLWSFHQFHHLDTAMNTTTALRFHIVELLFSTVLKAVVYLIAGFDYTAILIYEGLFFTIVLLQHSNIRISRKVDLLYRKIFSSPLMHRIHHSNKQIETDSNYSSIFSCWDHLFGSYKKEAEGEIVFGVKEKEVKTPRQL